MLKIVYRINKHYTKNEQRMPLILVKLYVYQMLRALAHIHAMGVCHRYAQGTAVPAPCPAFACAGRGAGSRPLRPPFPLPLRSATSSRRTCW